jgi:hypothetical protein
LRMIVKLVRRLRLAGSAAPRTATARPRGTTVKQAVQEERVPEPSSAVVPSR